MDTVETTNVGEDLPLEEPLDILYWASLQLAVLFESWARRKPTTRATSTPQSNSTDSNLAT